MMSGELFAAVIENTILKNSTGFDSASLDADKILGGFDYAAAHGINESLFKVRILSNVFGESREGCYAFLLGCVLCDEAKAIINHPANKIVIGGQKQMREAMSIILSARCGKEIISLSDLTVNSAVARGAIRIYECK